MSSKKINNFLICSISFLLIAGCNNEKQTGNRQDKPGKGTIYLSIDESFKPVMESMIAMYEADYPESHLIASYKPEAECLKDFFYDTLNRMVIVTRGISEKEDKYMLDSLNYRPAWDKVANDAIAIIVNAKSNDTVFTISRLQQQLTGKIKTNEQVVFDGLSATSTVRYISDSILHGEKFDSSVVKAARTSQDVIDFVANNDNAIGFVGISWVGNPEDTAQVNMLKKIKIAYVQCDICKDSPFVKPMQATILSRRYPLVRGLYYMLKENYFGLGSAFVNFMKYERGQLIFRRAYLGPMMDFDIRNVKINEKLK